MMETLHSSLNVTQRNIPEDDILHSHRRENLQSYKYKWRSARSNITDFILILHISQLPHTTYDPIIIT
jgi:hypothetical protein